MKLAVTIVVVLADDASLGDVRSLRDSLARQARANGLVRELDAVQAVAVPTSSKQLPRFN